MVYMVQAFPARWLAHTKIAAFPLQVRTVTIEQRLVEIEIKITRQEDLVQELNSLVYQQQKSLDELRALCTALVRRLGEGSGGADPYVHEKPPHY
ncbi:SlyX family protein [Paralcaligenes sp. KSB-10]|uniref:SlyX family protein n=1 Tax=Paralcaligenes sp. KSB-10 TaxID=2901142 RepID=UPI00351D3626